LFFRNPVPRHYVGRRRYVPRSRWLRRLSYHPTGDVHGLTVVVPHPHTLPIDTTPSPARSACSQTAPGDRGKQLERRTNGELTPPEYSWDPPGRSVSVGVKIGHLLSGGNTKRSVPYFDEEGAPVCSCSGSIKGT